MRLPQDGPRDVDFVHDLPAGPFVHDHPLGWGDADPAQIAYTANIPGWGLRALEAWYKACLGCNWFEMTMDFGVGTPFVHLTCDFVAPITPRMPLRCTVTVDRLGRSSIGHRLEGGQDGRVCFRAGFVAAFVDSVRMKAIRIPPVMRDNIERFADRQGTPWERVV